MDFFKDHLMYLAMAAVVFISTFAVSMSKVGKIKNPRIELTAQEELKGFPKLPVNTGSDPAPTLTAQASLVYDIDSGVSLFQKNPDKALLPASTTKIITALVAMDAFPPTKILTAGSEVGIEGQKMGLRIGEEISVNDLLYGLLVYSANDAAEVLAKNYCDGRNCGRVYFVAAMNKKAKELGLTNTNFTNPVGLDNIYHFSTARDLVKMSAEAMKNKVFAQIVSTKETSVSSADKKITHKLVNINELLGKVDGVLGIKTGWTAEARENLVTYVVRDNKKVLIALLGSQDRFGETTKLIDWIYTNYEWKDVIYDSTSR